MAFASGGKSAKHRFISASGWAAICGAVGALGSTDDGEAIESCTILTTEAVELPQPIHDRMPVILDPKDYDLWLDPAVQKPEQLQQLLCPYRSEAMIAG